MKKKPRVKHAAPAVTTDDGTPIIMKGLPRTGYPSSIMKEEQGTRPGAAQPQTGGPGTVRRAVGSSTYVPPPVPSPMAGGPSPQDILRSAPQLNPPVQQNNSFSDRVTRCNHSFTFGAGVGNNPRDRDSYVRSCVN